MEGRNGTTYTGRWQILVSVWFKNLCKVNKFSMHGGGGKAASGEGVRPRLHRAMGLRKGNLASLGPDLMGCCKKRALEWT